MIDSNETIMYDNGYHSGYDVGFDEGCEHAYEKFNNKIDSLKDWLEGKIYKLTNKDSIRAYQTVLDRIIEQFGLED